MTMQITMKQTRYGAGGALLNAGSSYSVTESLGAELVGAGFATDVSGALQSGLDVAVMGRANPLTGGIEFTAGGEVVELGGSGAALLDLLSRKTMLKSCWLGNSVIASGDRMIKRVEVASGGRIVNIKNAGVSGRSLQGVIDAMAVDIDPAADIVFVSEGSNSST